MIEHILREFPTRFSLMTYAVEPVTEELEDGNYVLITAPENETAELLAIFTHDRGSGMGTALLHAALSWAESQNCIPEISGQLLTQVLLIDYVTGWYARRGISVINGQLHGDIRESIQKCEALLTAYDVGYSITR